MFQRGLYAYHIPQQVRQAACLLYTSMISPALYWVMTGDDFSLDINNPAEPKILVVGNNNKENIPLESISLLEKYGHILQEYLWFNNYLQERKKYKKI